MRFRTRLALTIAVTFTGAIACILVLTVVAAEVWDAQDAFGIPRPPPPVVPDDMWGEPGSEPLIETSSGLDQDTFVAWAVVILIGFAVLATVLAWWISARSLRRIDHMAALARSLSESDLHLRLNLDGPHDEIREFGEAFDAMLDRLEAGFHQQRQFVANASHELRTPLTTVRAALEIPLAQGQVPPGLQAEIEAALRANRRSEELIDALLVLARGSAQLADPVAVDLAEVVGDALRDAMPAAEARGLTVISHLAPVVVRGDKVLLTRVVANVLGNAVRHNVDGGTIQVDLTAQEDDVTLRVENPGREITADEVERLTEPFFRGAGSRLVAGGSGLGLSIVQSVVTMHGGSLQLEPREGGGLIVTARLPATTG